MARARACGEGRAKGIYRRAQARARVSQHQIVEAVVAEAGKFESVSHLVTSSPSLQAALVALVVGLVAIGAAYRGLSSWTRTRRFSYTRPHLARFVRAAVLPIFAIALVSSVNAYTQSFALFEDGDAGGDASSPRETFARMLNTINIFVIGYTVATLIPVVITQRQKAGEEAADYAAWRDMRGFPDDEDGAFASLFRWIPPKHAPEGMDGAEFAEMMSTAEGRARLESYRTEKGIGVGSHEATARDAFARWRAMERAKYSAYLESCLDGSNESGHRLRLGQPDEEVYPIDTWREERRNTGYSRILAGARPPGHAKKKRKDLPRSATEAIRVALIAAVSLGLVSWWGVNLWVLATATGGLAVGVGLALQETMQNWFAYLFIRKDSIMAEGDRVKLESGYEGYIHRITPRVTYIRHALHESIAIVPTRQLVNSQLVNYTRETMLVPASVSVGVSYLNDPRQVSAILVKVGRRAMAESIDERGRHLVRQKKCPYVSQNRPSCGCDRNIHVSVEQPVVRFTRFNDSSLDFEMWVYVRDYGSQFKAETDMRVFMHEEFKRYDIRIPWPIRTIYQGDEAREASEIASLDAARNAVVDEHGIGDISRGGGEE